MGLNSSFPLIQQNRGNPEDGFDMSFKRHTLYRQGTFSLEVLWPANWKPNVRVLLPTLTKLPGTCFRYPSMLRVSTLYYPAVKQP